MLQPLLLQRADSTILFIEARVSRIRFFSHWLPLLAFVSSLFFAFPSYDVADDAEMADNWNAILVQTKDPFKNSSQYHVASHQANLSFRLTPPLIGMLLGIDSVIGFLVMQAVALLLLFYALTAIFFNVCGDRTTTFLLTLSVSFIFVGNVLCSDYRGFFDVLSFLFMAGAMLFNYPLWIMLSLLLAYFCDERALIASPLIYLLFVVQRSTDLYQLTFRSLFDFDGKLITVILSWVIYVVLRLTLSEIFNLKTNTDGLIHYLINETTNQVNILPFAVWTGLEGFWIPVLLSFIILLVYRRFAFIFFLALAMAAVIFVSIWVFDITRSMAYIFPSAVLALTLLCKSEKLSFIRYCCLLIVFMCIFPTYYAGGPNSITWYYPLPLQVARIFFL